MECYVEEMKLGELKDLAYNTAGCVKGYAKNIYPQANRAMDNVLAYGARHPIIPVTLLVAPLFVGGVGAEVNLQATPGEPSSIIIVNDTIATEALRHREEAIEALELFLAEDFGPGHAGKYCAIGMYIFGGAYLLHKGIIRH